jgi:starch synthase (maltosyl-transferring)
VNKVNAIVFRSQNPIGRLPILHVKPTVDQGRWPAKAFAGEVVDFEANVFREGHDALAAEVALTSPAGKTSLHRMHAGSPGTDTWHVKIRLTEVGSYRFKIQAFADNFETWHHNTEVKLNAGVDQDLMMLEGIKLLTFAAGERGRPKVNAQTLFTASEILSEKNRTPEDRFAQVNGNAELLTAITEHPIRSLVTLSDEFTINCERETAGAAAWYEFFPRSEGAIFDEKKNVWKSGTFKTAAKRLQGVADMGFDVLYLPPIHPIGSTFRKGPNNSLDAATGDPGSPWAVGSAAGGHDAVHPDLGTDADFEDFVKAANKHGLEIAMDLALQASPDHPWVTEHPEWFTTRADGTIAYAENPPKKYQDIYPINFDNDPEGIYLEVLRIVNKWIATGVKIFRVDNPHTKPLQFWEWLIGEVNATNPEVVFLAEAFTRPSMMHGLGKVGFQQSYTYFTWRNTKDELVEYLNELAGKSADFFRPNLWVSTPDILTQYLQFGGRPAHKIRAAIAATAGASWGMYAGYELVESVARPGAEEHLNSEKYEYRPRNWHLAEEQGRSLAGYITKLNEARKNNPALRQLRNLSTHWSDDSATLVFSKFLAAHHTDEGVANAVIVVANVDPHSIRETTIHLDLAKLGLDPDASFEVVDQITGKTFYWSAHNYVRLDAFLEPVHILKITQSGSAK